MIGFNGMSTCSGLFHAFLSNMNDFQTYLFDPWVGIRTMIICINYWEELGSLSFTDSQTVLCKVDKFAMVCRVLS